MDKFPALSPRSIGPSGMSGRVTAIDVIESEPNTIFIGSASGGIWKTETGGLEWTPIFDDQAVASIGSLCIYQANPDIIWAGTGEGNPRNSLNSGYGIYKSIDGGKTWELKGLEKTRNIHRVIIDPVNPDIVYVGAIGSPWGPHPERGVYKTTDGGDTWEHILFTNEKTGCADLVMDPGNPNKLIAAMWEHQRWPWYLKSGGEGSAMHITWDGGKTWKKVGEKEGLPKGELGRMGLAIAASNSKRVYALVESEKNAFYRSNDGGMTWRKGAEENIGNRPFYYWDLFVDPNDEDRIYTLYSRVNKSEDGGNNFENFMRSSIHPDHHAFYISPANSDFMIDGNDGGLAITHDRGASWRFVTNLPLGQFYHVNYDMEWPYNVYGGLQDNGSWYGPAYNFSRGGIQFYDWITVMGGDGFDVVPDSSDNRYGYAMSQGGNVGRYDRLTGRSTSVKPLHPEGKELRFHWNAAIAHDPVGKTTIYYGSQYVHKSTDRGESWEIISPDLTTNDTAKIALSKKTGGLTFDITGAENHCTIIAISPSPLDSDIIWVGTDDGNIQITRDGGASWTNTIDKIKGLPDKAWVPVIHASDHNKGEAFAVVNNYRQNDFSAYLYHTLDFGKTWKQVASDDNVWGYCLSVVQDPLEPNLVFMGTEYGLYMSIDRGQSWNKWTNNYPTVPTMDLKIHPREHDLIIGTFGRSLYILDDIRPLRILAKEGIGVLDEAIKAYPSPAGYQMGSTSLPGVYGPGDGYFRGENKDVGAILSYSVKEPIKAKKRDSGSESMNPERPSRMQGEGRPRGMGGRFGAFGRTQSNREFEAVKIEIFNAESKKIKSIEDYPKAGINRVSWRMDEELPKELQVKTEEGSQQFGGRRGGRGGSLTAFPGTYLVTYSYGGEIDSSYININIDPRESYDMQDLFERRELTLAFMKKAMALSKANTLIKEANASLELILKQIPKGRSEEIRELRSQSSAMQDSLKALQEIISPPVDDKAQGITRSEPGLQSKVSSAQRSLSRGFDPVSGTAKIAIKLAEKALGEFLDKFNAFFSGPWASYKEFIGEASLSPFSGEAFESLK
ncbi:MAG: hypothetical protein HN352_14230 [Bacteroidetes bacterium]|nr:hypothetical protein [Bacteroidota bacterium]MBT4400101.1 hypothetical protein [Bacteroidota bacterium]MBT4411410.1 hypothetical protein [Bacteroidota bacterium]MBT5425200.1 hypothetical protein [Bacteroidota bacterium]MBT7095415.1 hypothetical protein [Bacteroidota bacterium]